MFGNRSNQNSRIVQNSAPYAGQRKFDSLWELNIYFAILASPNRLNSERSRASAGTTIATVAAEKGNRSITRNQDDNEIVFHKEQQKYLNSQLQHQLKDKSMKDAVDRETKRIEQEKFKNEAEYARSVSFTYFPFCLKISL